MIRQPVLLDNPMQQCMLRVLRVHAVSCTTHPRTTHDPLPGSIEQIFALHPHPREVTRHGAPHWSTPSPENVSVQA